MRFARAILVLLALSGCRDGDRDYSLSDASYDPSLLTSSGGDVSLTDGTRFDFAITSDRYLQWDAARKGLSRAISARFGALLNPAMPSNRSMQRAIAYLEGEPSAREAITRAGMTVRDFVLMTVALEQQMRIATRTRSETPVAAMPAPLDPPLSDTLSGYEETHPYAPAPVNVPADSGRRVDTVFLPRDSVFSPVGPDTLRPRPLPPRDSLRRGARDTTSASPPDTLPPRDSRD